MFFDNHKQHGPVHYRLEALNPYPASSPYLRSLRVPCPAKPPYPEMGLLHRYKTPNLGKLNDPKDTTQIGLQLLLDLEALSMDMTYRR